MTSVGHGLQPCDRAPLRLVLTAARTLWFIAHVDREMEVPLWRYRPWYRQKVAPSQLDVAEACWEALHEAGIFPIPRSLNL